MPPTQPAPRAGPGTGPGPEHDPATTPRTASGPDRALWYAAPFRAEIRPAAAPPPGPGEVRIRAVASGLSRGTEALVFAGRVPESERGRMRCPHQEGDFPFPVKYGYAACGVVEDGPAERIGQRVLCLHPHQSRFTVAADAALPVPPNVPPRRAVLAPQIETALNATWDAAPRLGDRIAVVGAGTIGCLVAWLCARIPGAEVVLLDPDARRAAAASRLGVPFAADPGAVAGERDVVFHASATPDGLATALDLAGFEAMVAELSWYGTGTVPAPLGAAFHSRRLHLVSSQVGAVAPARRARWPHARRLALALSLAAAPELDVLVAEETPLDALPDALPDILGRPGAFMHRVAYPGAS